MSNTQKPHKRKLVKTAPGTPPGTLFADPKAQPSKIQLIAYGADGAAIDEQIENPADITSFLNKYPVTWVNVVGLADIEKIRTIGQIFDIHPLALEDVVNLNQRAKVEQYENHQFLIAQIPMLSERLDTNQFSLFLGKNYVVTFEEAPSKMLEPVLKRVHQNVGLIRTSGPDYLAYTLIDTLVDGYFPVLEEYGERLDTLEDQIISKPDNTVLNKMHDVKRDLLTLRRAIWPMREAVNSLFRDPTPFVTADTRIYLRDCYDHVVRIMDLVETYRELSSDLMDVYLSSLSNRLNEVIKVLTIISTIFIPPTFIAGIYGMNFNRAVSPYNMPETNWYYGYPLCLAAMALMVIAMLGLLWQKGWLGSMVKTNKTR